MMDVLSEIGNVSTLKVSMHYASDMFYVEISSNGEIMLAYEDDRRIYNEKKGVSSLNKDRRLEKQEELKQGRQKGHVDKDQTDEEQYNSLQNKEKEHDTTAEPTEKQQVTTSLRDPTPEMEWYSVS